MARERLLIIIPADVAQQANSHAKEVDLEGGEKTFTVGLSPTGSAPATHYWCSWAMDNSDKIKLTDRFKTLNRQDRIKVLDGNARTPQALLDELGLKVFNPRG